MVAKHGFIPALQMLLENPLLLVGAQQANVLIAALNDHLRELKHGRHVINPDVHINRIGAHGAHLHHRNRGVFQPVANGVGMFNAEQNRCGDI